MDGSPQREALDNVFHGSSALYRVLALKRVLLPLYLKRNLYNSFFGGHASGGEDGKVPPDCTKNEKYTSVAIRSELPSVSTQESDPFLMLLNNSSESEVRQQFDNWRRPPRTRPFIDQRRHRSDDEEETKSPSNHRSPAQGLFRQPNNTKLNDLPAHLLHVPFISFDHLHFAAAGGEVFSWLGLTHVTETHHLKNDNLLHNNDCGLDLLQEDTNNNYDYYDNNNNTDKNSSRSKSDPCLHPASQTPLELSIFVATSPSRFHSYGNECSPSLEIHETSSSSPEWMKLDSLRFPAGLLLEQSLPLKNAPLTNDSAVCVNSSLEPRRLLFDFTKLSEACWRQIDHYGAWCQLVLSRENAHLAPLDLDPSAIIAASSSFRVAFKSFEWLFEDGQYEITMYTLPSSGILPSAEIKLRFMCNVEDKGSTLGGLGLSAPPDLLLIDPPSHLSPAAAVVYHFVCGSKKRICAQASTSFGCAYCCCDLGSLAKLLLHLTTWHIRLAFFLESRPRSPQQAPVIIALLCEGTDSSLESNTSSSSSSSSSSSYSSFFFLRRRSREKIALDLSLFVDSGDRRKALMRRLNKSRKYFCTHTMNASRTELLGTDSEDDELDLKLFASCQNMGLSEDRTLRREEKKLMSMWNQHVTFSRILGDLQVFPMCMRFIEVNKQALAPLRHPLTLHLTAMLDFGLLSPTELGHLLRLLDS